MRCGLALFAAAWRGLPRGQTGITADSGPWAVVAGMGCAYAQLLRLPPYLLHVLVLGLTTAAFYMFLSGAPAVLNSYGVGPGEVGFFIMAVPVSYIAGNFMTSRLVRRFGGPRLMRVGQAFSLTGVVVMLALGLAGQHAPWAFALPLLLLGIGHGLLVPLAWSPPWPWCPVWRARPRRSPA